jgi:hypothetical protein
MPLVMWSWLRLRKLRRNDAGRTDLLEGNWIFRGLGREGLLIGRKLDLQGIGSGGVCSEKKQ